MLLFQIIPFRFPQKEGLTWRQTCLLAFFISTHITWRGVRSATCRQCWERGRSENFDAKYVETSRFQVPRWLEVSLQGCRMPPRDSAFWNHQLSPAYMSNKYLGCDLSGRIMINDKGHFFKCVMSASRNEVFIERNRGCAKSARVNRWLFNPDQLQPELMCLFNHLTQNRIMFLEHWAPNPKTFSVH